MKVWREKRGLTRRELAAQAKVSPSYLAEIKRQEARERGGAAEAVAGVGDPDKPGVAAGIDTRTSEP